MGIQSTGSLDGTVYAQFTTTFDSGDYVIPPGETVVSPTIENVLLVQGAIASLAIIPDGILDGMYSKIWID